MMLDLSLYTVVLFLHVASAVVLIGSSLFTPLARRMVQAASSRHELLNALEVNQRASRYNLPSALVLLVTGLYLGSMGWWTQAWFIVAVLAWVCNGTLAGAVVHRIENTLERQVSEMYGGVTEEIDALRHSRTWTIAARVMLANDAAMLYLMMTKPGWAGTLVLLGAVNALLVGPVFLRQGAARPVGVAPAIGGGEQRISV